MIDKKNIKKIIIDVDGSSYIEFETDLKLKNETLGDFYWQGDEKFFEINMLDLTSGRNEEFKEDKDSESLEDFLTEEAIKYITHLANYELQEFV